MLSEHIFFIIERISDILKVDNERNEILTLYNKELSHDERKLLMELFLDDEKKHILDTSSDEEIREIMESHSDDERKEFLRWYLDGERNEFLRWLVPSNKIMKFLILQREKQRKWKMGEFLVATWAVDESYSDDEIQEMDERRKMNSCKLNLPSEEFMKMYRELSDDGKEEFLHNYILCWRNTILKYLEFRQRLCFQNLYGGIFFNILTSLIQGKEVVLSKDVKKRIGKLQQQLKWIHPYLKHVEAEYGDRSVLSEYQQQLYLNLSHIAHSSDDILDRIVSIYDSSHEILDGVSSKDDVAHDMDTLLQTIHNLFNNNLSSTQFKLKLVVKDNINEGVHQNIGNPSITINHNNPSNIKYSRPKSYGHVPSPDLVGFNHEIQILLNHLIQPHYETRVVGIVGPGGSGKTTLAKHIYRHPQINSHFASKVWVCISQSWDKTSILNSIWRQAKQNPEASEKRYEQLVECLPELLSSKSYLVIVDDVWNVDAWYDISPALPPCSGSKVVVTTRNKFLPQRIDHGVHIVEPKQLNDEESYELFKKRALLDENVHPELKSLAVEMVKKCKGLPLAVIALAGVLGIDKSLSSWEKISKGVTDKMLKMANETTQGVVKEILALSYYELPQNLKPCALYLGFFPEDDEIEAPQLIEMWIAECFMDEEDKAQEYIDELAQRCIVEVVETNHKGQVLEFRIHDLIREMLINIERGMVRNEELRLALCETLDDDREVYQELVERYDNEEEDFNTYMEVVERNSHARSLIFHDFPDHLELELLFIKLKLLRVLVIDGIPVSGVPEEIGNLIHLRYLQLSGDIGYLCRSIGNLENLLTLNLENLYILQYVDTIDTINLEKLKELRHLYMPKSWTSGVMGFEKVKKWKTLLGQVEVVFRMSSITSNNLRTLSLQWGCKVGDMSRMSKCTSITKLKLNGIITKGTPLMFPPNLILLEMSKTEMEEKQVMNIISNSCPLLKFLFLKDNTYTGTELICDENSFPQLEKLELCKLENLKWWIIERGAMPRLNHLIINNCPSLEVNEEGWERISIIPHLSFWHASILEQKLRMLKSCTITYTDM